VYGSCVIVGRAVVITFLTLFLGLVYGPIDVALFAPPEVARIELHLDGTKVADLGPPWRATIDLGPEVAPRELIARRYDRGCAGGRAPQKQKRCIHPIFAFRFSAFESPRRMNFH